MSPIIRKTTLFLFVLCCTHQLQASEIEIGCTQLVNGLECTSGQLISGAQVVNGDVNGSYDFAYAAGGRSVSGSYAAGVFELASRTFLQINSTGLHASASGSFYLDDLMITGPGSGTVQTSFNFNLAGTAKTRLFAGDSSAVDLDFGVSLAGANFSGNYERNNFRNTNHDRVTGLATQIAAGAFINDFDATILTPAVSIAVNQTFSLGFNINARSSIGFGYGDAAWDIRAFGPLAGTKVFNLDDGYTVNSASGLIVDNCWISCNVAGVPEPSSLALLVLGLLLIQLRRGVFTGQV